jgi:hypothetical protein
VDAVVRDADLGQEGGAGLAGVAVGGVGGDVALVAEEEVDRAPVDTRLGREPRDLAVDGLGDGAAGETDGGYVTGGLRSATRLRNSPATAEASASAVSWTSMSDSG